jgi:homoserine O-acetyltransferase/O-succinyltransferase
MSAAVTEAAPDPGSHAPSRRDWREGLLQVEEGWGLEHGGRVAPLAVAWRLHGESGPVVAAMGGISAGRMVCDVDGVPGWWGEIAGPGRALDTDRYRVLGVDFLGGSHDSSGPQPGAGFPSISSYDQALALRLVLDRLGIVSLAACVGASYGGMVALAFAERFPARLRHAVVVSAAHRTHPMSTAWRSVQRAIVRYALSHGEGPRGLALARALAMATYRSAREFEERFAGAAVHGSDGFRFPVESYLMARGEEYATRFRPEAFVCLSESIDLHRVDPAAIRVPVTLLAVTEDQLVPIADVRMLRDALGGGARLVEISSTFGHDAFLKEKEILRDVIAQALADP